MKLKLKMSEDFSSNKKCLTLVFIRLSQTIIMIQTN